MKAAPYSESDYRWLAGALELLIDIGKREETLSFNTISRSDYRHLSPLLEELVDTVGENVHHPATSLMMFVGFLIERYEKENVPKLSDLPTELVEAYYNRGLTKSTVNQPKAAEHDLRTALKLAKQQRYDNIKVNIKQRLKEFNDTE